MLFRLIKHSKETQTLALGAIEIFGAQLSIGIHYMLLAIAMPPAAFGQLSALYSLIYLGSSVGSSGMASTLTLLKSHNDTGNQSLMHAIVRQWWIALPLAALTTCGVGFCSLHSSCDYRLVLVLLSMTACLSNILKKQLNHAARLWGSHWHTVIAELLYYLSYMTLLALAYATRNSISPLHVLIVFNVCTWLFSIGYACYLMKVRSAPLGVTQKASSENQHAHRALSELAKVGYSPNAIVLLVYSCISPEVAGLIKLLHASGQIIFSSLGRLIDTYTHLTYARNRQAIGKERVVHNAMRLMLPIMSTGIFVVIVGVAKNSLLQEYVLQYPIAAAMLALLFATNYAENTLRFNLFRLGRSTTALKIALTSIGIVFTGIVLGNAHYSIGKLSALLLAGRAVSLAWLCVEAARR